jgi:hypothetical protein
MGIERFAEISDAMKQVVAFVADHFREGYGESPTHSDKSARYRSGPQGSLPAAAHHSALGAYVGHKAMRMNWLLMAFGAMVVVLCLTIVVGLADVRTRYWFFGAPPVGESDGPYGIVVGMDADAAEAALRTWGFSRNRRLDLYRENYRICGHTSITERHDVRLYFEYSWRMGSACLLVTDGRVVDGNVGYSAGII